MFPNSVEPLGLWWRVDECLTCTLSSALHRSTQVTIVNVVEGVGPQGCSDLLTEPTPQVRTGNLALGEACTCPCPSSTSGPSPCIVAHLWVHSHLFFSVVPSCKFSCPWVSSASCFPTFPWRLKLSFHVKRVCGPQLNPGGDTCSSPRSYGVPPVTTGC